MTHNKIGPDRFSRSDVSVTNILTNIQGRYICILYIVYRFKIRVKKQDNVLILICFYENIFIFHVWCLFRLLSCLMKLKLKLKQNLFHFQTLIKTPKPSFYSGLQLFKRIQEWKIFFSILLRNSSSVQIYIITKKHFEL